MSVELSNVAEKCLQMKNKMYDMSADVLSDYAIVIYVIVLCNILDVCKIVASTSSLVESYMFQYICIVTM